MNTTPKVFEITEAYNELIQYVSCLGKPIIIKDFLSVTIRLFNNSDKEFLKVVLSVPKSNESYDYNIVEISWRYTSSMLSFEKYKCSADIDQKVIFNILLFNITNWKLDNIK